jgi:hypothetical protein
MAILNHPLVCNIIQCEILVSNRIIMWYSPHNIKMELTYKTPANITEFKYELKWAN